MGKPITAYKWYLKKGGNKDDWATLSENEKNKYTLLAKNDRDRYIKENPTDFKFLKVKELKILCKNNKLKVTGKKAELIERLEKNKLKVIGKKAELIEKLEVIGKKAGLIEYDITQTVKEKIESILN